MELILTFLLVFARIYGMFAMLPLLTSYDSPKFWVFTFCASLTPFIGVPLVNEPLAFDATYLFLMVKEMGVGAVLGLLVSLPLLIPAWIGELVDNQRGTAVTETYNPALGEEGSSLGTLLMLTTFTYFVADGGLLELVKLLGNSYALFPVGHFGANDTLIWQDVMIGVFNNSMKIFGILALPMVVMMFLVEIGMGLASRTAQSLNVFQMAQPVKSVVALLTLIAIHPRIVNSLTTWQGQIYDRLGG